jgi:hypothetical protein
MTAPETALLIVGLVLLSGLATAVLVNIALSVTASIERRKQRGKAC